MLSSLSGLNARPMMNSVEPPPMSATRRLSFDTGRLCETPRASKRASRHPLDRTSQCRLGLFQKTRGILGHPQRIGADRAHRMRIETAQPLAEALQAFKRAALRALVEAFI